VPDDAATLPAPAVAPMIPAATTAALVCPAPWPLWWLLVAAAAGAAAGVYARRNKKQVRKNLGRAVHAGAGHAFRRVVG
jgi:hypothetical protein